MSDEKTKTATVTGTVTSVSQFGVKLDRGDDWINLPYGVKDVIMPAKGQRVTLTLNAKGKILHIVPAAEQEAAPEDPQARQDAQPAAKTDWARKDALMVRMSCLRGACEVIAAAAGAPVAGIEDVTLAVKRMAASFERWVNREGHEPEMIAGREVPDWADFSPVEPPTVDAAPPAPVQAPGTPVFATAEIVEIIRDDVRRLGWTGQAARKWLHEHYNTPDPTLLTVAQANAAIDLLSRERAVSNPEPQAAAARKATR